MINARSEGDFLWRGIRAAAHFRLQRAFAWVRYGHVVRRRGISRYLSENKIRRLHLGATYDAPGFLNSQITGKLPIDLTRRLPLPDGSFDMIYSSHVVEHIHRIQFFAFLAEAHRVLRHGGQLIIATPSLRKIISVAYGNDDEAKTILLERGRRFVADGFFTPCHQVNILMRAFGHRFLYDLEFMQEAGRRAGFRAAHAIDNRELPDESLRDYIVRRKAPGWFLETETFVLVK